MKIIHDKPKGVNFSSLNKGDTFYYEKSNIYGIVVSNLSYKEVSYVPVNAISIIDGNSYCFEHDQMVEKIELEARVL